MAVELRSDDLVDLCARVRGGETGGKGQDCAAHGLSFLPWPLS
jgi:hypothetical protein